MAAGGPAGGDMGVLEGTQRYTGVHRVYSCTKGHTWIHRGTKVQDRRAQGYGYTGVSGVAHFLNSVMVSRNTVIIAL